ncbi:MAG: hypothetical protein KJP07_21185 [Desulfatitalea sp.]|nr:hypothetical protein [Desulfatitalea sp.]NNJ84164.1 hypothetical protein [Gammaproteobacteria bacterium]
MVLRYFDATSGRWPTPANYMRNAAFRSLAVMKIYSGACFNAENQALRVLSEIELAWLSAFLHNYHHSVDNFMPALQAKKYG